MIDHSACSHSTRPRQLIIGPAWVGDMVMTQTLLMLLKHQQPDCELDVLAPAWTFGLLQRMPEVATAIAMPLDHHQLQLRQRRILGKRLRTSHYQQAIVIPNSFKSALIPFWAKIPQRTGWSREGRWLLLNDARTLDKERYPRMIERLAALAFKPDMPLPTSLPLPRLLVKTQTVAAALQKHQLIMPTCPVLVLCPGAEFGPSKRWPPDYYAQVARHKLVVGWQVWLLGSAKDRAITEQINRLTQQRCVNLAGQTTLAEAIDLLSLASAVVTNDSGLMHIAAALERPLVALYGSSSPQFTPPLTPYAQKLTVANELKCRPCFQRDCPLQHHRCMRDLTPEQVLQALDRCITM